MLLASLAYKAPRAELEALLVRHGINGASGAARPAEPNAGGLRPFPIAATMFLSLAGLWLASTALNAPGEAAGEAVEGMPPSYPVMAASGFYSSPVALAVPPAPPAGWSMISVTSGGGATAVPVSPYGSYSVAGVPVMVSSPAFAPRVVSSYSVTTMSDGRAQTQTVRIVSSSSRPTVTVGGWEERVAPAGTIPMGEPARPMMLGIGPGAAILSVRSTGR